MSVTEEKEVGKKKNYASIPIEQKKTYVWIKQYNKLVTILRMCPDTNFYFIADREADFYEMFAAQGEKPEVDVIIRAKNNRNIESNKYKNSLMQLEMGRF